MKHSKNFGINFSQQIILNNAFTSIVVLFFANFLSKNSEFRILNLDYVSIHRSHINNFFSKCTIISDVIYG